MSSLFVLAYGISSYLIGFISLLFWILIMLGVFDFSFSKFHYQGNLLSSIVISSLLMGLFALQHTIMARSEFKNKLTQIIPGSMERSSFVLMTGLILIFILLVWPTNTALVWEIENTILKIGIYTLAALAWAYLFVASFAINHFELFGLQQSYLGFKKIPIMAEPFKERLMYRFDRHPIMTGAIVGIWCTPVMRMDHLLFSVLFTLYIVVGVSIEEKDLVEQWGEKYMDYRNRVKSIVPVVRF